MIPKVIPVNSKTTISFSTPGTGFPFETFKNNMPRNMLLCNKKYDFLCFFLQKKCFLLLCATPHYQRLTCASTHIFLLYLYIDNTQKSEMFLLRIFIRKYESIRSCYLLISSYLLKKSFRKTSLCVITVTSVLEKSILLATYFKLLLYQL